jgi:hypothetical protein
MAGTGASTEKLPQQLTKLSKAMLDASEGSKSAQHEFHQLGIETDGWAEKMPDPIDVLLLMAHHLRDTTNETHDFAIAQN